MARRKEHKKEAVKRFHNENRVYVGVEDMVLLEDIKDSGILANLKQRLEGEQIYTYIGNVLVACNPYKWLTIYEEAVMQRYVQMQRVDVPPHIFATAEAAFRNMILEEDNQCVIISGESGAGKTEASKQIQSYIAKVSGGGERVELTKRIFLESNPVLEAFGNAKTLRNNNSSRFGKYFELKFDKFGCPMGGVITNYLLEKSRICSPAQGERNFHIFYQLLQSKYREQLSLPSASASAYGYLSGSGCEFVSGVDDKDEFDVTLHAMRCVGLQHSAIRSIFALLAAILHLGNIAFEAFELEDGAEGSKVSTSAASREALRGASEQLQIPVETLEQSLTYRELQTNAAGGRTDTFSIPQNTTQAQGRRDAVAKALYERMFNLIIHRINLALEPGSQIAASISSLLYSTSPAGGRSVKAQSISDPDIDLGINKRDSASLMTRNTNRAPDADIFDVELLSIGVLDIYGFEVFEANFFEQLCINYVNEKLQQIFIELTLNAEQQEYADEGIAWESIPFFNNKVVCDLLDALRPPGLFRILDDHCRTMHGEKDALEIDRKFTETARKTHSTHAHFQFALDQTCFTIKHYAGDVVYQVGRLAAANKDALDADLLKLMRSSQDQLLPYLFPDEEADGGGAGGVMGAGARKRGGTGIPSAGACIRTQTSALVVSLMECSPHYVRCIKSNDTKSALRMDQARAMHQVQYLGLAENVKVRRAGFAYRADYHRFLDRFALLSAATYPEWRGTDKDGCMEIMKTVSPKIPAASHPGELQYGNSKIFIRTPDTYFQLERLREKKQERFAEIIQRVWRAYRNTRDLVNLHNIIGGLYLDNEKVRRRDSIYCPFLGVSLDGLGRDEVVVEEFRDAMYRIVDYYDERETVLFVDINAAQIVSTQSSSAGSGASAGAGGGAGGVSIEDRVLVLTSGAVYVMERIDAEAWTAMQKAAGAKPGSVSLPGSLFLRRRIALDSELSHIIVSKLADNCVVLETKAGSAVCVSNDGCGSGSNAGKTEHLQPLKASSHCAVTGKAFSLTSWRYQCVLTGKVVNAGASQMKQALPDLNYFTPQRVSDPMLGLASVDLLEDIVLLSTRKTEFVALLAFQCVKQEMKDRGEDPAGIVGRKLKLDRISVKDRISLRTCSNPASRACSRQPSAELLFQQQDAKIAASSTASSLTIGSTKTHSVLYQVDGPVVNIFTPRGISNTEMMARRQAQMERQQRIQERRERENAARRERLRAKQAEREAVRMQKINERKNRKKAEREARRNRAVQATNVLTGATGVTGAGSLSPSSSKSDLTGVGRSVTPTKQWAIQSPSTPPSTGKVTAAAAPYPSLAPPAAPPAPAVAAAPAEVPTRTPPAVPTRAPPRPPNAAPAPPPTSGAGARPPPPPPPPPPPRR